MPGDIVVGDGEGAVVIPPSLVVELGRRRRCSKRRRRRGRSSGSTPARAPSACSRCRRNVEPSSRRGTRLGNHQEKGAVTWPRQVDRDRELQARQPDSGRVAHRTAAGVERDRATRPGRADGAGRRRRRSTPTCSITSVRSSQGPAQIGDTSPASRSSFPTPRSATSCNPIWVEHFPDADARPARHSQVIAGRQDRDLRVHRLHRRLTHARTRQRARNVTSPRPLNSASTLSPTWNGMALMNDPDRIT